MHFESSFATAQWLPASLDFVNHLSRNLTIGVNR